MLSVCICLKCVDGGVKECGKWPAEKKDSLSLLCDAFSFHTHSACTAVHNAETQHCRMRCTLSQTGAQKTELPSTTVKYFAQSFPRVKTAQNQTAAKEEGGSLGSRPTLSNWVTQTQQLVPRAKLNSFV